RDVLHDSVSYRLSARGHYHPSFFFFFNDTATTEIYTLSLHDALPISSACPSTAARAPLAFQHRPVDEHVDEVAERQEDREQDHRVQNLGRGAETAAGQEDEDEQDRPEDQCALEDALPRRGPDLFPASVDELRLLLRCRRSPSGAR